MPAFQSGKFFGFTLSEVLVTLGIIGVVAAMTLPALIQKQQKQEASSRLKKFVSTFSQAILFAENDFGPHADWQKGEGNSYDSSFDFLNTYIKPYVKSISIEKGQNPNNPSQPAGVMKFLDGSTVTIKVGTCYDIYYDYNGDKKPNVVGKDIFAFVLCRNKGDCSIKPIFRSFYCQTQEVYDRQYPKNRQEMIEECKRNITHCTILLENDNWEFKKDYPF